MSNKFENQAPGSIITPAWEPETTDTIGTLKTLAENYFLNDAEEKDEYVGVVLGTMKIGKEWSIPCDFDDFFETARKGAVDDLVVYVRIEDLHAHLPNPADYITTPHDPKNTNTPGDTSIDKKLVTLHIRVLYQPSVVGNLIGPRPPLVPGAVVKVKFKDKKNLLGAYITEVYSETSEVARLRSEAEYPYGKNPHVDAFPKDAVGRRSLDEERNALFEKCKEEPRCGWYRGKPLEGYAKKLVSAKKVPGLDFRNASKPYLIREEMIPGLKALVKYRDDRYKGLRLQVNHAFRSYREQRTIFITCPTSPTCHTAARPGRSFHQTGFAIDFSTDTGNTKRPAGVMEEFLKEFTSSTENANRLTYPFPTKDPVHIEYSLARSTLDSEILAAGGHTLG
jgi:hypothetical protein